MKATSTFLAIFLTLSACSAGQSRANQDDIIDTTKQEEPVEQAEDSVGGRKTLNEIRFEGWGKSEWLDNEYIRTLRKYLDDYNSGKVSNENLDPYKEQVKGKFVIYEITPYIMGGAFIRITFLDMPDRVFSCSVYSEVNEETETVESYELRSISIEEGSTGMTKEDIMQALQEMEGLKLW